MGAATVTAFLDSLRASDPPRLALVLAVREQVLGAAPSVSETVKYGGLLFSVDRPFCGIFSYARHVSLEFGEGASFPDPHQVLEGQGRQRRHIKLTSLDDLETKHVRDYLALAVKGAADALT